MAEAYTLTLLVDNLAGMRVRTGPEAAAMVARALQSAELEVWSMASDARTLLQSWIRQAASLRTGDVQGIARIFQELQSQLGTIGANRTQQAVKKAAHWFYKNVETAPPSAPPAPLAPATSTTPATVDPYAQLPADPALSQPPKRKKPPKKRPLTKRLWFWPAVIGGVGLTLAGVVAFWPKKGG